MNQKKQKSIEKRGKSKKIDKGMGNYKNLIKEKSIMFKEKGDRKNVLKELK
jgi:hypothetical protein